MEDPSTDTPPVTYLSDLLPKLSTARLACLISGGLVLGIVVILPFFIFFELAVPRILKARRNYLLDKAAEKVAKAPGPKTGSANEPLAAAHAKPNLSAKGFVKSLFGKQALPTTCKTPPVPRPTQSDLPLPSSGTSMAHSGSGGTTIPTTTAPTRSTGSAPASLPPSTPIVASTVVRAQTSAPHPIKQA
uniref:Col_cuticle_N domain-containing protein n=1 Tax=Panagrellus redivivus TaxID=6233 RepID=A0A7E4USU3_PANRE